MEAPDRAKVAIAHAWNESASMEHAITGGCQCRQVRYAITPPPTVVYCCHCRDCQKQSASAFAMSVPVRLADLSISGRLKVWERATDTGGRTRCHFCADCGSRIYHQSLATPDHVTIKAGSLDDTHWLKAVAHIWISRKQAWVELDPAIPAHPTQPDDLAAWRHGEKR